MIRLRHLLAGVALSAGIAGCDSALQTEPVDRVPSENQIVDASTARAALIGTYDGLQALSYYGRTFLVLGDLSSDNARHRGTFQYLGGSCPLPSGLAARADRLARCAAAAMPEWRGYIGIDLVLGEANDGSEDYLIEVNPRLTTSYVGLRVLAAGLGNAGQCTADGFRVIISTCDVAERNDAHQAFVVVDDGQAPHLEVGHI